MRSTARGILILAVGIAIIVTLLGVGSFVYWFGEGRPDSPEEFREMVAESGLVVDWTNNGPSAGEGFVTTDCGDREVSVNKIEDELWIRVDGQRAPINGTVITRIRQCDDSITGN